MNELKSQRGLALLLIILVLASFATAFLIYGAIGGISKRLDAAVDNTAASKKIDSALAQFVMLNGRLPCPASGTAHTGVEDPKTGVTDPYKDCNSPSGIVPWAALNLDKRDALDSWGRYIAYRVKDGTSGYTQINGLLLPDCLDESISPIIGLTGPSNTCNTNTHENTYNDYLAVNGLTVKNMGTDKTALYALISMGQSGLGAYYPGGSAPLTAPTSANELQNAGSGGTYWMSAPSDPSVSADSGSHFDDVVTYGVADDVIHSARVKPGKPWKLYQIFSQSQFGLSGGNYNTGTPQMKVRPAAAGIDQGPVTVMATGILLTHNICVSNSTVQGATSCLSSINNGSDMLDNLLGAESLEFDFRVTRKVLVISLSEFRYTGGGSNKEQAQITFYNGATQVDQQTVQACSSGGNSVAQFTVTPAQSFTKVTVTPLTVTGSGSSSSFSIAAILACKVASDCPSGAAPTGIGWPAIDCFG